VTRYKLYSIGRVHFSEGGVDWIETCGMVNQIILKQEEHCGVMPNAMKIRM